MLVTSLSLPDMGQVQGAIDSTVQSLDWSAGSKDVYVLLAFAVSILLHFFFLKKHKVFALLFSIYTSYLVVIFFPYNLWLSHLSLEQLTWYKVIGFLVLTLVFMTVFVRGRIFATSTSGIIGKVFRSIVFGILNIGLLLTLLATLLPLNVLGQFSGFSLNLFTTELGQFIWIALPAALFLFSFKFRRRGPGRPPAGY